MQSFFTIKLVIKSGRMIEVYIFCLCCDKNIVFVLTGDIEIWKEFFKKSSKSAVFFRMGIIFILWNRGNIIFI